MSKGKLLAICILWLLIAGTLAASYRLIVKPTLNQRRLHQTSSPSNYRHEVRIAVSAGWESMILRSRNFRDALTEKRIQATVVSDTASDVERLKQLSRNDITMASFTLTGLLHASAEVGDAPGTIVAVLGESNGADGIVTYRKMAADVRELNRSEMRFVATAGHAGETLARLTISQFGLDQLPPNPFEFATSELESFERYRKATPEQPLAFVLREPHLGRSLENGAVHRVAGSAAFRGPMLEVLVVERDFLVKNEDVVRDILGAYFRAAYTYRADWAALLKEDLQLTGQSLTDEEIKRLIATYRWKNTLENFAHFGIDFGTGLPLLEDAIRDVTLILRKTGGIAVGQILKNPTEMYYVQPLQALKEAGFHPGSGSGSEVIRSEVLEHPELNEQQWDELIQLKCPVSSELLFARGSDRLLETIEVTLKELAAAMATMPRTYVTIRGNADSKGNADANVALAQSRAQAVGKFLLDLGMDPHRVRVPKATPTGRSSVSLEVGQLPY